MDILFRKMFRDLREAKGQFFSILVIVILGVMFYSGINASYRDLSKASAKYYQDNRFADLWADFYKAPESIVKRIEALPFVKMATGRIVQDAGISISGENATLRFITLPDDRKEIVNDIIVQTGHYFSGDESNQCLLEEGFYKAHGLKPGDYIYPTINGNTVKLKVLGSVKSPEFVYPLKDGSELMPDYDKFGIVFVKSSFGQAIFGYSGSINSISILLKDGTDTDKAKEDIKQVLKGFGVTDVIDRGDQLSNQMLDAGIKKLQTMGGSFPVIFFIVAAVIIYIMMSRMVENQRVQIGVLKALGYSNPQVLLHYLSYSVLIAVIGCAVGSLCGMLLGIGFTRLMNMYYNLPLTNARIYLDLVLPASMLTLFFCLLAGYNSCKRVFRIMPSEAMKPKAPKAGRKILVEKIRFLWANLSYIWRIILRNVFRYKRRALMTSIGIIFSTAILLVALGMEDSVNYLMDQQYGNIQDYDLKVSFSKLMNVEEVMSIKSIPHVTAMEPVLETGVEASNGWIKKNIGLTILVRDPQIYKVTDKDGKAVELPQQGVLIPQKLAEILNVKPNDSIYLKSFYPDKEKKEIKVQGVITQYIGLSAYGSFDYVNSILGEGRVANAAVLKLDSSASEQAVKDSLEDMPAISSIQSKADSYNNFKNSMAASTSSVGVMIILASVLSIAVVYNIATINIFERKRELATLKVVGFKDSEIRKMVFYENYLITIFGMLLGLPLGRWLGSYMMGMSGLDTMSIPFVPQDMTYVTTVVLALAFTSLANFTLRNKVRSIDMIEVLKSNE